MIDKDDVWCAYTRECIDYLHKCEVCTRNARRKKSHFRDARKKHSGENSRCFKVGDYVQTNDAYTGLHNPYKIYHGKIIDINHFSNFNMAIIELCGTDGESVCVQTDYLTLYKSPRIVGTDGNGRCFEVGDIVRLSKKCNIGILNQSCLPTGKIIAIDDCGNVTIHLSDIRPGVITLSDKTITVNVDCVRERAK